MSVTTGTPHVVLGDPQLQDGPDVVLAKLTRGVCLPAARMEKRPDLSLTMRSVGMATSMGGVPGEVMLGGGRSSTRRSAMLSTLI